MNESRLKATRITVPEKLYDKALKAIKEGKFPGVRNFSAIVEVALVKLLQTEEVVIK